MILSYNAYTETVEEKQQKESEVKRLNETVKDRDSPDRDLISPIVDIEDINGVEKEPDWSEGWLQCDSCKRWWSRKKLLDYHKKKTVCGIPALGDEKENL